MGHTGIYTSAFSGDQLKYSVGSPGTIIADEFSTVTTYKIDDYVLREGLLYQCIAETSGAWNAACWVSVMLYDNDNYSIFKSDGSPFCVVPVQSGSLYYTGSSVSPVFANYVSEKMNMGGTTSATIPGTYSATFTLVNTDKYQWDDFTTASKSVDWTLQRAVVEIPTYESLEYTYSGTTIRPFTYDAARIIASGASGRSAGTYTATFTLNNTTYMQWADGTTEPKTFTWVINKAVVELPTCENTTIVYTGSPVSPVFIYDTEKVIVGGDTSATSVGSYTATFTLNDVTNYKWTDDTSEVKTITWIITDFIMLDSFTLESGILSLVVQDR